MEHPEVAFSSEYNAFKNLHVFARRQYPALDLEDARMTTFSTSTRLPAPLDTLGREENLQPERIEGLLLSRKEILIRGRPTISP